MSFAAERLMDVDEFFAWQQRQEKRYELVDGVPMEMMTGASRMHDLIVTNIIALLKDKLRGGPCHPTTADIAVRTRIRSLRRPDVTVTCDPPRSDVYDAREPRMVVEVLSPSNKGLKWTRKLDEYRRHEALDYILLVDSESVGATLYSRSGAGWDDADADRLADAVELPKLNCRMMLAEIYEGTDLQEELAAGQA
jgi:Uma2 family endonuclease